MKKVIKRDGRVVPFNLTKIIQAITNSDKRLRELELIDINAIARSVHARVNNHDTVETIQDIVEEEIMTISPATAKSYILYRAHRNTIREAKSPLNKIFDGIVSVERNNVNNENANMDGSSPSSQMMTMASTVSKNYAHSTLLDPLFSKAHKSGDIHIHDLDYYPTKSVTCTQYDLKEILANGFSTKNGYVKTPKTIGTASTLTCILFQSHQNEQHGGQAIPALDYALAPYVYKSFIKNMLEVTDNRLDPDKETMDKIEELYRTHLTSVMSGKNPEMVTQKHRAFIGTYLDIRGILSERNFTIILNKAFDKTKDDVKQAMEGMIYNLNTMHSRGGGQVVFSSINYGTDTSIEGRMVIDALLNATDKGLGNGETPIFPIQIFKVKEGVTYSKTGIESFMSNPNNGVPKTDAPNFDLFLKSCKISSKRLFPNYVFLDTTFNKHEKWNKDDPNRYLHEIATMG